jgi:hypothetical protein
VKLPCRLARVLDEGHCPPSHEPHDINHYPHYYDALYYPQCHSATFESPEIFCTWLKTSLASHPQFCLMCRYVSFRGCVSYDGVCITVSCQQVSISIALSEIADTNYRHCVVFCKLSSREVLYPKVSVFEVDCLSDVVLLW